jgi:glycosyltransferase involved in cell wall biosynthesis
MPLLDGTPAMAMRQPAISVVIPTYNWSAALRCAIRSVLLQTMQDFEILVVGDGCTDDSEAIVAAFNDPRLRWYNLDRNYGSQWAANNFAIEHAAADWIAYLGHDDIWYPTHLAAILRTAELDTAEIVTSTMIFYGRQGLAREGSLAFSRVAPPRLATSSRLPRSPTRRRCTALSFDGAIQRRWCRRWTLPS